MTVTRARKAQAARRLERPEYHVSPLHSRITMILRRFSSRAAVSCSLFLRSPDNDLSGHNHASPPTFSAHLCPSISCHFFRRFIGAGPGSVSHCSFTENSKLRRKMKRRQAKQCGPRARAGEGQGEKRGCDKTRVRGAVSAVVPEDARRQPLRCAGCGLSLSARASESESTSRAQAALGSTTPAAAAAAAARRSSHFLRAA